MGLNYSRPTRGSENGAADLFPRARLVQNLFDIQGQTDTFHVQLGGGAVPEPSTWALMMVGFGGLGAMLRRRSRTALTA